MEGYSERNAGGPKMEAREHLDDCLIFPLEHSCEENLFWKIWEEIVELVTDLSLSYKTLTHSTFCRSLWGVQSYQGFVV